MTFTVQVLLTLLTQVIMRHLTTEEVSVFTYEEWLSRTRGPKRTMICEMAAVVDEELMVELTTYIIQVKTSDVAGESSEAKNPIHPIDSSSNTQKAPKLQVVFVSDQAINIQEELCIVTI